MSKTQCWPKPGVLVKDPDTRQAIPSKGGVVNLDGPHRTYWRRRILDGDLLLEDPTEHTKARRRGGSSAGGD